MATQEQLKRRLKAAMARPENQVCSDCAGKQPRWASLIVPPPGSPPGSLTIGAFCCLECSGSHRKLGVHISFVRSINLDTWKEKEVEAMERGGNKIVNAIFEARLSEFGMHSGKPSLRSDGRTRERYVRDKYERRKFYDPNGLQQFVSEEESSSEEETESSSDEEVSPKKKPSSFTIRAPSEVAKQRAESRTARLNNLRTTNVTTKSKTTTMKTKTVKTFTVPKSKPTEPEIDLLGFNTPLTTDPGPPPDPPSRSSSPPPDVVDLFANVNITSQIEAQTTSATTNFTSAESFAVNTPKPEPQQSKKLNNDEILSMFNTPPPVQSFNIHQMMGVSGSNMVNPAMNNFSNGMYNNMSTSQQTYNSNYTNQYQATTLSNTNYTMQQSYTNMMTNSSTATSQMSFHQQQQQPMGGNVNYGSYTMQHNAMQNNNQQLDRNGFPLH
jgi:stromal membrane-associated protein